MAQDKQTQPKPVRVRGTGIFEGDNFAFRPSEQGEPTQLDVKTCKGGKTFLTTSERKPQKVAHLSCAADSPDPWTEFTDKLRLLGIKPLKEQSMPARQRLVAEAGMEVYLAPKTGELAFSGTIDLTKHSRDWQAEVLRQVQLMVRRLPANERFSNFIKKTKSSKQ